MLNDIELIQTSDKIYSGFNDFMLGPDLKVFGKLLARTLLFNKVKDIPGDIIECGVFKGTGLFTFLKLKRYFCPNSHKKVIGFDFFDSKALVDGLSGDDKKYMGSLFNDRRWSNDDSYYNYLGELILSSGFFAHEFSLVKGDLAQTASKYVDDNIGFKISLLFIDVDIAKPTRCALEAFWDRMSRGGIIVFDEYAYHKWSESNGVDIFFKDKGVTVKSLNYIGPSAYVIKE